MSLTPAHLNLFPGALKHVEGWDPKRLEARSKSPKSSQALCVSVFGTIAESPIRKQLMEAILERSGIRLQASASEEPRVECEFRGERELLREHGGRNPTCPDVLVTWPSAVVTVESKFTESLDSCRQRRERRETVDLPDGSRRVEVTPPACSGNYAIGSDLRTRSDAPCRLSVAEGLRSARRYWELAEHLFRSSAISPPQVPCPFSDGRYQLMRNLCFAYAWAERDELDEFAFLLSYVGGTRSAERSRVEFHELREMAREDIAERIGSITYEEISALLRRFGEAERDLAEWIDRRLAGVASAG